MSRLPVFKSALAFAAICAIACALPAGAAAWNAVVLPKDSSTLDVSANGKIATAVFVTMQPSAKFLVTLDSPLDGVVTAELYVPARAPERDRRDGLVPILVQANGSDIPPVSNGRKNAEDPATGLRFQFVSTMRIEAGSSSFEIDNPRLANRALVVIRGSHAAKTFVLDDATKVPQTVARMRAWYDTPADGKQRVTKPHVTKKMGASAILSGVIVAAMIALAMWWGLRGRATARRPRNDDT